MLVPLVIGSALFSGSLGKALVPTASTSDPTITPGPQIELFRKQNDARYMGWVNQDGNWTSQECNADATYYQSSNQWRCCATTADGCPATEIPVGCTSGVLIFRPTGTNPSEITTLACTSAYIDPIYQSFTICNTAFMYENEDDSDALTNVNCGLSSKNWSYFRVAPTEATATTSPSSSPSSPNSNPDATPTPNEDPAVVPTTKEKKNKSKAWIAGAVVGPIIGLALIGFIVWFMRRRKNAKHQATPAVGGPPAAPAAYPQQSYTPGPSSPPQYYPPPMQQNHDTPGMVPFGVAKHDTWGGPQSPTTPGSTSPGPQGPYGGGPPQQQWQGQNDMQINQAQAMGGQPGYAPTSPSMTPQPGQAQPAQYDNGMYKHMDQTARPFSSELEGSSAHGQPEYVHVQPK